MRFVQVHDEAKVAELYHAGLLWWNAWVGHENEPYAGQGVWDIKGYMWFDPAAFALIEGLTGPNSQGVGYMVED